MFSRGAGSRAAVFARAASARFASTHGQLRRECVAKRARCIVPLPGMRGAIGETSRSLRRLLRSGFDGAVVNPQQKSGGEADGADGPPGALGMMGDFAEVMHHRPAEPAAYQ